MFSVQGLTAFILLALSVRAQTPPYVLFLSCWTKCLLLSMYLVSRVNFSWNQVPTVARILHLKAIHAILMTINIYSQMLDSYVKHRWSDSYYTNLQWFCRSKMGLHRGGSSNPWKQMLGRNRRQQCRRHKTSDMDMYSQWSQPNVFLYSKLQPLMHSMRFLKSRSAITVWFGRIKTSALILLVEIKEMALP